MSQGVKLRLAPGAAQKRAPQSVQLAQYERVRELGRGSYGAVWLVRRKPDRKLLAMKTVVLPPLACNEEKAIAQRRQALREAEILQIIESPHVVRYIDAILAPASTERPQSELHLVTEYCDGGDLATRLRKVGGGHGLPETAVWNFAAAMLSGLQELHARSVLHRDLKLANVFLKRIASSAAPCQSRPRSARSQSRGRNDKVPVPSPEFQVLLGDLGVAREMSASEPFASTMIGTPLYCAPEVFEGQPYGEKADVYSFGICVYELMHGRPPFAEVQNMGALVRNVLNLDGKPLEARLPMDQRYSGTLRTLVSSCLDLIPTQRPDAAQLIRQVASQSCPAPCDAAVACTNALDKSPDEVSDPDSGGAPPLRRQLVRHSSQPRAALIRHHSVHRALIRSPSVPVESIRTRSPRSARLKSPPNSALADHKPQLVARAVRTPSPRARFNFQPPQRHSPRVATAAETALSSEPAKHIVDVTCDTRLESQKGSIPQNVSDVAKPCEIGICNVSVDENYQLQSRTSERGGAKHDPGECSAHSVYPSHDKSSAGLNKSSSAPLLCFREQPTTTGAHDSITHIDHANQCSCINSACPSHQREEVDMSMEVHEIMPSSSPHGQARPSANLTSAEATASPSRAECAENAQEEMPDVDVAKTRLITPRVSFQPRPLSIPTTANQHDNASFSSPKSVSSTPHNSTCSKPFARSGRTSRESFSGASPRRAVGQASVRNRGKAYVARAQECFSRWRREKLETRIAQRKEVAQKPVRPGQSPQYSPHGGVVDPSHALEIHGIAPPSTPTGKNAARGSLPAARVLYTPPGRRAKGMRS